jgi:hypothetical protein
VYRIGPERELIGKSLAQLQVEPSHEAGVELDDQALFGFVDRRTDFLPAWVQGRLTGRHGQHEELAIAVDGRVVATTWSFEGVDGTGFDAMVPEQALRNGRNDVVVLRVRHDGGTVRLEELRGTTVTVSLVRSAGREEIRASDGTVVRVRPGALRGFVQVATGSLVRFAGWAALASLAHRADSLVVIADGHQVFASPTAKLRPHRLLGYHRNVGFQFELPRGLLPPAGPGHHVRVYAVGGGFASELRVKGEWPWR